jgi:hypothetical protein
VANSSPYGRELGTSTPNTSVVLTPEPRQFRKFLHITRKDRELLEVAGEIAARFSKLYPDEEPLEILKLQDANECDLDPDYIAGDIFDSDNVVHVLLVNEIKSLDATLDRETDARAGKRRASGNLSSLTIPKKRVLTKSRESLWSTEGESRRSTPLSNQVYPEPTETSNRSFNISVNDDSEVSLPPPEDDDTRYEDPRKQKPAAASPLPSSKRITSGMLVAPEPQLKDAAEATLHEQEINEKLSQKKIPTKKVLEPVEIDESRKSSPPLEEILASASRDTSMHKAFFSETEDEEDDEKYEEASDEPEFTREEIIKLIRTNRMPASVRKKLALHSLTKSLPAKSIRAAAVDALKKIAADKYPDLELSDIDSRNDSFADTTVDKTSDRIFENEKLASKQGQEKPATKVVPSTPSKVDTPAVSFKSTVDKTPAAKTSLMKTPITTTNVNGKTEAKASATKDTNATNLKTPQKADKISTARSTIKSSSKAVSKSEKKAVTKVTTITNATKIPVKVSEVKSTEAQAEVVLKEDDEMKDVNTESSEEESPDESIEDSDSEEDVTVLLKIDSTKAPEAKTEIGQISEKSQTQKREAAKPRSSLESTIPSPSQVNVKTNTANGGPVDSSTPASSQARKVNIPKVEKPKSARALLKADPYNVSLLPPVEIDVPGLEDIDVKLSDPKVPDSEKAELMETRKRLIRNAKRRESRRQKSMAESTTTENTAIDISSQPSNTQLTETKTDGTDSKREGKKASTMMEQPQESDSKEQDTSGRYISSLILPPSEDLEQRSTETKRLFDEAKAGILAKRTKDAEPVKSTKAPATESANTKVMSSSGSDSDSTRSDSDSDSDSDSEADSEDEVSKAPPRIVNTPKTSSQLTPKTTDLRKQIAKNSIAEEPISKSQLTTPSKDTVTAPIKRNANSRKSLSSLTDLVSRGVPEVQDSLTPKVERASRAPPIKKVTKEEFDSDSEESSDESTSGSDSESGSDDSSADEANGSKKFLSAKSAGDLVGGAKKKGKRISSAFKGLIDDFAKSQ